MDLVRHYYSTQNSTAPPFRIEYLYTFTHSPNMMRTFLVNTAAFRSLEEAPRTEVTAPGSVLHKSYYSTGSYVSQSIKDMLAKHPDIAVDFVEQLVKLHRNGEADARKGPACA
jgi:hypothetical protein